MIEEEVAQPSAWQQPNFTEQPLLACNDCEYTNLEDHCARSTLSQTSVEIPPSVKRLGIEVLSVEKATTYDVHVCVYQICSSKRMRNRASAQQFRKKQKTNLQVAKIHSSN